MLGTRNAAIRAAVSLLVGLVLGACGPHADAPAQPTSTISPTLPPAHQRSDEREAMVGTIARYGVSDARVLEAMRAVPRHLFVPEEHQDLAYADRPLPIGYGQTISQPYIVAFMTEQLHVEPGDRVLEIGTGSGYQAAVLAALGDVEVYTIEIVPELAESAARRLAELGYDAVHAVHGDGYYGWEEHAPYDAIVVTAAPDHLPQPLVQQLAPGGSLVIPIGPPGSVQTLWRFVREPDGLKAYNLGGVMFVPFTGPGIETASPGASDTF